MTTTTPQTTSSYHVRIVVDDDYFPDSWDFIAKTKEQYEEEGQVEENGSPVPWERYHRTWGDPDNYVQLGFELEQVTVCTCCGSELDSDTVDSVGGCQFYIYDADYPYPEPGVYTLDQVFDPSRREFEHVIWSLDFPDDVKSRYQTKES